MLFSLALGMIGTDLYNSIWTANSMVLFSTFQAWSISHEFHSKRKDTLR
jgi:hypothetical protein